MADFQRKPVKEIR